MSLFDFSSQIMNFTEKFQRELTKEEKNFHKQELFWKWK